MPYLGVGCAHRHVVLQVAAAQAGVPGQPPATLVLDMYRKATTERRHVVIGTRETRDEPLSTRLVGLAFSLVMRRLALRDYPVGGFDCMVLSRRWAIDWPAPLSIELRN